MPERDTDPKESLTEEWKNRMADGVKETLDNYELFEIINFAPISLTNLYDPRTWHELNKEEKDWITNELFSRFAFNRRNEVILREYTFQSPTEKRFLGKTKSHVKVFETHRSKLENMYLHEITWPDNEIEFVIAPRDKNI